MKNFEKYIDLFSIDNCVVHNIRVNGNVNNAKCEVSCFECKKLNKKWLLEEYKEPIQLTHDEYVILKNLPSAWRWIVRNELEQSLKIFINQPNKGECIWHGNMEQKLLYKHLFQFIKWEDEPYSIEQLIADYEKEHEHE